MWWFSIQCDGLLNQVGGLLNNVENTFMQQTAPHNSGRDVTVCTGIHVHVSACKCMMYMYMCFTIIMNLSLNLHSEPLVWQLQQTITPCKVLICALNTIIALPLIFVTVFTSQMHPKPLRVHTCIDTHYTIYITWTEHLPPTQS